MKNLTDAELNQLESVIASQCKNPADFPFRDKIWGLIGDERKSRGLKGYFCNNCDLVYHGGCCPDC